MKKSTNKILKLMKNEYFYLVKSKIIYIILILFILIGINLPVNVNKVKQNYKIFIESIEEAKKNNVNVEEALKKDEEVVITQENGNMVKRINNPLRYEYNNLLKSIKYVSPKYLGQGVLEMLALIIGPIIFGIMAALFTSYDYKYKTIKIKSVENDWYKVVISKQLVLICVITITTLIVYFLFSILGNVTYKLAIRDLVNININDVSKITTKTNIFTKIFVAIFIQSFFALIVSLLTVIFKNALFPIIILIIYNLIIPNLGKLDIKNLILNVCNKTYDCYGNMSLFTPQQLNIYVVALILLSIYFLCFILIGTITNKETKCLG